MNITTGGRQLVVHGLAFILAGLLWGFVVPLAPYPRLALGAHVQFETNGMLFLLLGLVLLKLPHSAGSKTAWAIVISAWLTWLMALSEAANAWWGANQLLSISAKQAGATGAAPWQELIVKLGHIPAGLGLILSLILLIVGFVKHRDVL
jgi:(hydroxyamino)benzene mutase